MPTDTFENLSEEKKQKIIASAKKEFTRVPLEKVSIKNIVEQAEIARGSFYQYFNSKEDLLLYIVKNQKEQLFLKMKETLQNTKGDIFKTFMMIYDEMTEECHAQKDGKIYKKIFENIKVGEEKIFSMPLANRQDERFEELYHLINLEQLKVKDREEFTLLVRMIHAITKAALVTYTKAKDKKKVRENYQKQLYFLKYGVYQD